MARRQQFKNRFFWCTDYSCWGLMTWFLILLLDRENKVWGVVFFQEKKRTYYFSDCFSDKVCTLSDSIFVHLTIQKWKKTRFVWEHTRKLVNATKIMDHTTLGNIESTWFSCCRGRHVLLRRWQCSSEYGSICEFGSRHATNFQQAI